MKLSSLLPSQIFFVNLAIAILCISSFLKIISYNDKNLFFPAILLGDNNTHLVIGFECLLAALILMATYKIKFYCLVFLYSFFIAISLAMYILSVKDCGCFGHFVLANNFSGHISISVLFLLILSKPSSIQSKLPNYLFKFINYSIFVLYFSIFLTMIINNSGFAETVQSLSGNPLVFKNNFKYFGVINNKQSAVGTITIKNNSNSNITIVGASDSCSYSVDTTKFPLELASGQETTIKFAIKTNNEKGLFVSNIKFFTPAISKPVDFYYGFLIF